MVDDFVALMADPRYYEVKFEEIRKHIPGWDELLLEDLHAATKRYLKEKKPEQFNPYLESIIPRLTKEYTVRLSIDQDSLGGDEESNKLDEIMADLKSERGLYIVKPMSYFGIKTPNSENEAAAAAKELRKTFIELLRAAYLDLIKNGEIDSRSGIISLVMLQSLDVAFDEVSQGKQLKDWEAAQIGHVIGDRALLIFGNLSSMLRKKRRTIKESKKIHKVRIALALIEAHRVALERFKNEFVEKDGEYNTPEHMVVEESEHSVESAKMALAEVDEDELRTIVSRLLCKTILMKAAHRIEHMHSVGLITETEATPYLNKIQGAYLNLRRVIHFSPQDAEE
jgi:hypothetical protein